MISKSSQRKETHYDQCDEVLGEGVHHDQYKVLGEGGTLCSVRGLRGGGAHYNKYDEVLGEGANYDQYIIGEGVQIILGSEKFPELQISAQFRPSFEL